MKKTPDSTSEDEHFEPATQTGKVWLVGAGPGDPGLITVKGAKCIAEADVIIYDQLANSALLSSARSDCELLYAGKKAGEHYLKQEETNELIVAKALEGNKVCRLKGGDPFVFGRGGEEALALSEKGIPFEIVPGVTAGIGALAYAGIPVTHRGLAATVEFITGHEDPTKPESDICWEEISRTKGTLVFYMGVRNLESITDRLISGGRTKDTPAALVSNGTLPTQRTLVSTLGDVARRSVEESISAPALLVVGEVVSLRKQLAWFENKPLFGKTIVVTRARAQASDLAGILEEMGAEVLETPTIKIKSMADTQEMRSAAKSVSQHDWVVFTSVNGVDTLMESIALEELDARVFGGTKIAVIGSGTQQRLLEYGLRADVVPERFIAESLLESLEIYGSVAGQWFLIPRADQSRPTLVEGLRERGAEVLEVAAYHTEPDSDLGDRFLERLRNDEIDLVTFTSSSTVKNFVDALPAGEREDLLPHVNAASIGPITSQTALDLGVEVVVEAKEYNIPGLVACVASYFS